MLHTWDEMFRAYSIVSSPLNAQPRYNIAPTQPLLAVVPSPRGARRGGGNEATFFRWGLVPSWAKDISLGAKTINARAETVAEKPSFRTAFRRRRCLIPASGFYEWQTQPGAPKQPFWISAADGGLLTFAGIWESWMSSEGDELQSCAIITTSATDSLAPIHARMPVILDPADFESWLDTRDETDIAAATALLRPPPAETTIAWPVSSRVNNVRNDESSLVVQVEPVSADEPRVEPPPERSDQGDLFSN